MQFDKRNIDFKIHLRKHLKVQILLYSIFLYSVLLAQDSTFVEKHGLITVSGNRLVEKNDRPIVLRGMSLFWSQWEGEFYNYDCIKWLRDDWNCTVARAAMGVESGGYIEHPASEKAKIKTVIEACIDLGFTLSSTGTIITHRNIVRRRLLFSRKSRRSMVNTRMLFMRFLTNLNRITGIPS